MWNKLSEKWLERTINHCYAHVSEKDSKNKHFKENHEDCTLCQEFTKILTEENLEQTPLIYLWDQFHAGIIK